MAAVPEALTCGRCGEEVRWGWRPGLTSPTRPGSGFWMHRDPAADHHPLLGTRLVDTVPPEPEPVEEGEGEVEDPEPFVIPPPEVTSTPIDIGDERLPGGAKIVLNAARREGWTATATYSRGSRMHASQGTILGVSDFVVVRARLDGADQVAVASWKDGGFDYAYVGEIRDHNVITTRADSKALRAHLKQQEDPT